MPRLDIRRESEDKISSHIFNVIYQTKVLFCDKAKYYPIDWNDYLIGGTFFDRSFGSCGYVVKYDSSATGSVAESYSRRSGRDLYVLSWYSVRSSYDPIVQITSPTGSCASSLDMKVNFDCDDIR